MNRKLMATLASLALLFSTGCATAQNENNQRNQNSESNQASQEAAVRGTLQGAPDGEVIFTKAPNGEGVQMIMNATGLPKAGLHAVHIHENPVCDGNFTSAGGHYNPAGNPHGHPAKGKHHVGDLGNFRANAAGNIIETRTYKHLSLDSNSENFVGNRALVVHQKADDYSTQPTGGAGGRIGCAVLQVSAE